MYVKAERESKQDLRGLFGRGYRSCLFLFLSKDCLFILSPSLTCAPLLQVVIGDHNKVDFTAKDFCGALIQYPNTYGRVDAYDEFVQRAHANDVLVVAATVSVPIRSLFLPRQPLSLLSN